MQYGADTMEFGRNDSAISSESPLSWALKNNGRNLAGHGTTAYTGTHTTDRIHRRAIIILGIAIAPARVTATCACLIVLSEPVFVTGIVGSRGFRRGGKTYNNDVGECYLAKIPSHIISTIRVSFNFNSNAMGGYDLQLDGKESLIK